ncbi:MAG: type II toxin-antitoxin system VapC family toxin [Thaumarchaeota archaeon]|nr:type II toxin-antitoxin system VapC family toxin [Nitrososphaerota archaeon]
MMCIDSNIWIYYLSSKAKEHKVVARVMRKTLLEEEIMLNPSIILEVAHYFRSLPKEKLLKIIESMISLQNVVFVGLDIPLLQNSVAVLAEYSKRGFGARDATILASMQQTGIKRIMTHDAVFGGIEGIEVFDPLRRSSLPT